MKILMISSEAAPYAKTGGLADAVSALSKTLTELGHDVKILIPRYYGIDRQQLELCKSAVPVSTGFSIISVDFYKDGFTYFVDYEPLFGRDGVYGDKNTPDFYDNPLRFSVLSRSAFVLCKALKWIPDVIHSHDWAACLTPVLLNYIERPDFPKTKTLLSIHNQGYQGISEGKCYEQLGLSELLRYKSGLEYYGNINLLKAGIVSSDAICTVSKTYAQEIQTPEQGFGLDGLLRIRKDKLFGIVNGADLTEWNPKTDKYISANYSIKDMSGKAKCKAELQKRFGLPVNPDVPLIGMVGRLASQKGISELFAPDSGCIKKIANELNVQIVLVGSGEKWCQEEIQKLSAELPNFKGYIGYSEDLSHSVEAGSDFFLMPSRYEPCGLNQIYSMLYGTLPIVRSTGGLADTVENCNETEKSGTGFKFNDLTPEAIFNTVKWALSVYENKPLMKALQKNGMSQNFSWEKSAQEYVEIYKNL